MQGPPPKLFSEACIAFSEMFDNYYVLIVVGGPSWRLPVFLHDKLMCRVHPQKLIGIWFFLPGRKKDWENIKMTP